MRLSDFQNVNPGQSGILIYYRDSGSLYTVKQINVNINDCNNINLFDELSVATSITLRINESDRICNIENTVQKLGYFHYEIEDFIIPSGSTVEFKCTNTSILPGPDALGFTNSEYDTLISNATDIRTSGYIFEVDRSTEQVIPGNYDNIISESAQLAEITDSNYTSVGLVNSKYAGTKTSIDDFGVEPLVSGKTFEGAVYLTTASNNFICSQSLSDRKVEEYLFSIPTGSAEDSEVPIQDSKIFELEQNKILVLKDSKIWIKSNRTIIETNENGIVQSTITQCTVQ